MMDCIPQKLDCKGVVSLVVNVACIKAVVVQTCARVHIFATTSENKKCFGTTFMYKIDADESCGYIFTP